MRGPSDNKHKPVKSRFYKTDWDNWNKTEPLEQQAAQVQQKPDEGDDIGAAIEEACGRLSCLFVDKVSWTDEGPDTKSAKKKFEHAIGFLECVLADYEELRLTLKAVANGAACLLKPKDHEGFPDSMHRTAISIVKQGWGATERRGYKAKLNAFRNRVIMETREWISETYSLDATRGEATKDKGHRLSSSWIISEALRRLADQHEQWIKHWIARFPEHRARFNEHLKFVDDLRLSEKTISNMKAVPE